MLFLDEIHVSGPKIVYNHVWVGNVQEIIPKDHPRVLEEGPKLLAKPVQDSPTKGWESIPIGPVDAPLVRYHCFRIIYGRLGTE